MVDRRQKGLVGWLPLVPRFASRLGALRESHFYSGKRDAVDAIEPWVRVEVPKSLHQKKKK